MEDISFFSYYLFAIIGYVLVYGIGHLVCSLFFVSSNQDIYTVLKKNIIGFVTILCLYSIYKTHLHTINIGWIIIAIILLVNKRIKINYTAFKINIFKIEYKYIFWQFYVLSVLYIHSFYLCKSFTTNDYFLPFANIYRDPYFYGTIINNLVKIGIENPFTDQTNMLIQNNVALYHYGELWFAAFFYNIFKLKPLYVFSLITFPIYSTYLVLASITLIKLLFNKINKYVLLIAPLLLIVSAISFFYPLLSFMDTTNVDTGLFTTPKYTMLALFIIIQFIFIYKEDFLLFILTVFASLIIYTGLIAPFGLAVILLLLLLLIIKKITFLQITEYGVYAVVFLFFTIGLIFLQNTQPIVTITDSSLSNNVNIFSIAYIISLLKFCMVYSIKFILSLMLPVGFLLIYRLLKKQKVLFENDKMILFFYFLFLFFSSIFTSGIFLKLVDSFQFRINIYTTTSTIVVFIIIQYLIIQQNKLALFITFLLISFSIFQTKPYHRIPNNYNKEFAKDVLKEYKGEKIARFISSDKSYMNTIVYFPMEYMMHYTDVFYPICVNVFDGKIGTDEYIIKANNIVIPLTSFYKYYIKSKQIDSTKSIQQVEVDFIENYNFKYLVFENKKDIPIEIQRKIEKTYFDDKDSIYFSKLY